MSPEIEAAIGELIAAKREHAAAHIRCKQVNDLFTAACNERSARMNEIYNRHKVLADLIDAAAGVDCDEVMP